MARGLPAAVVSLLVVAPWVGSVRSDVNEIVPRSDAPKPRSPEESQRLFRLRDGFRIELVASEPLLADPTAITFDAQGRIYVCELHGYNLDGYLDVVELNKKGVLDKAVRRIPASPEAQRRAAEDTYGTVKLLDDTDGDGRPDRARVLADRLPPCYGLVPAHRGVIVVCAPDIIYLADRDGDGKAEVRETLFTGFGVGELWTRINNPRWGLDNWIYVGSGGGSGGTIRGPRLGREVRLGSTAFRFKPDGSALEPAAGGTGGFGQALTDWGDRFFLTNSQHALYVAPLPYRYLARNPYHAAPNPMVNASGYFRVYPASIPHPWRLERSRQPAWVEFYGARETTANGYFTAVCAPLIYRAAAFPPEYHGNHFTCESQQNLIHRCLLERDGAGYVVRRAPGEENTEFLTSTEGWFRPVNLSVGPDGALYIVDMYREIIEDYSAIPRYLQQQYGLITGHDRGRLWRVVAEGAARGSRPDLATATTPKLVEELSNPNPWWRQTAQRLIVERGDKTAVGELEALVVDGKSPQARLHALYTLEGLDSLRPAVAERATADAHFAVRLHGMRLGEKWLNSSPDLLEKTLHRLDDPDPRVRLQLALTLGEAKESSVVDALAHLALRYGGERWMRAAILSSVSERADRLLEEILAGAEDSDQRKALLGPLSSIVGARHLDEEIGRLLQSCALLQGPSAASLQSACLNGLLKGLQHGQTRPLTSADGTHAVRRLLGSSASDVRLLAFQLVGALKLTATSEMNAAFESAGTQARDASLALGERKAALRLLASAPYSLLEPVATRLLDAHQPPELQLLAVNAFSAADDPGVVPALLSAWERHTPKIRGAVLEAIFSRQDRLPALLDSIEEGLVPSTSIDSFRRLQLLENPDDGIRWRARQLLAVQTSEKSPELFERYRAALSGTRDPERGKVAFKEQCARCHKVEEEGYNVGPDLATTINRTDESWIAEILQPSTRITTGFGAYTIVATGGKVFNGVLASETATSIVLRREEGMEDTILRKDVLEMMASQLSLMPDDIETVVTPQNLADILAYLRGVFGPPAPAKVILFEDELSFVESLNEGGGKATIESDAPFSGGGYLSMTPPQRYSSRIPGWTYRILENPGPGEFRYLRWAWKSVGGDGVMIELAADGNWPRSDDPARRYYSGKNTTKWKARQVSAQLPGEWTVVTVDLWKDNGALTLTGLAPTAMGGEAHFDRIELLRTLVDLNP